MLIATLVGLGFKSQGEGICLMLLVVTGGGSLQIWQALILSYLIKIDFNQALLLDLTCFVI